MTDNTIEKHNNNTRYSINHLRLTQAALRPLSQAVVSLSAVVAALALHQGFAATLARDQPGGHVGPRVAQSALQGPGRVAVTRCGDTERAEREKQMLETGETCPPLDPDDLPFLLQESVHLVTTHRFNKLSVSEKGQDGERQRDAAAGV